MPYAGLRDEGAQLERARIVREVSQSRLPCHGVESLSEQHARELITRKRDTREGSTIIYPIYPPLVFLPWSSDLI